MTKVASLNYGQVIRALRRDGWVVVRQKGSHIRLQKAFPEPIKRSTLAHILKQANLSVEKLKTLL